MLLAFSLSSKNFIYSGNSFVCIDTQYIVSSTITYNIDIVLYIHTGINIDNLCIYLINFKSHAKSKFYESKAMLNIQQL